MAAKSVGQLGQFVQIGVRIPLDLADRVRRACALAGIRSLSEFARDALALHVDRVIGDLHVREQVELEVRRRLAAAQAAATDQQIATEQQRRYGNTPSPIIPASPPLGVVLPDPNGPVVFRGREIPPPPTTPTLIAPVIRPLIAGIPTSPPAPPVPSPAGVDTSGWISGIPPLPRSHLPLPPPAPAPAPAPVPVPEAPPSEDFMAMYKLPADAPTAPPEVVSETESFRYE